jgi:hypothetical protein
MVFSLKPMKLLGLKAFGWLFDDASLLSSRVRTNANLTKNRTIRKYTLEKNVRYTE